jgi:hypothetical protein
MFVPPNNRLCDENFQCRPSTLPTALLLPQPRNINTTAATATSLIQWARSSFLFQPLSLYLWSGTRRTWAGNSCHYNKLFIVPRQRLQSLLLSLLRHPPLPRRFQPRVVQLPLLLDHRRHLLRSRQPLPRSPLGNSTSLLLRGSYLLFRTLLQPSTSTAVWISKQLHYMPAMPSITRRLVQLTNMARLVHVCYLSSIYIAFRRSHHADS